MFEHTRPAQPDPTGHPDPWAEFRVDRLEERVELLRRVRDGNVPVILNAPDGGTITTTLWAVDPARERMNFGVDEHSPTLGALVDGDELVAMAYLDSVKLQFDVHDLVLVRGHATCTLQSALPREIYRFQRRSAYRVNTGDRVIPTAQFRHPSIPEMPLVLRVLDVSSGGCALLLPPDVPPLQAGTMIGEVRLDLDADTHFTAGIAIQHVGSLPGSERGLRLGCEWQRVSHDVQRTLQRWIDQTQKRRRFLILS